MALKRGVKTPVITRAKRKPPYWPAPRKERIAASISAELRAALVHACEQSGRSMTQEIEARLRVGLDAPSSGQMILCRIDGGLWAYMQALHESGVNLYGSIEDQAIFAIRTFVQKTWESDAFAQAMLPHLPKHIRDAMLVTPRFMKSQPTLPL